MSLFIENTTHITTLFDYLLWQWTYGCFIIFIVLSSIFLPVIFCCCFGNRSHYCVWVRHKHSHSAGYTYTYLHWNVCTSRISYSTAQPSTARMNFFQTSLIYFLNFFHWLWIAFYGTWFIVFIVLIIWSFFTNNFLIQ